MKQYNIYCDESSIENFDNPYFIIGALFMERCQRDSIKNKIKELKGKYNFRGEIKWNKITSKLLPFYKEIVDLFTENELSFHCIKVERQKVDYDLYHNSDTEEGFFKFYYQLFKNKFDDDTDYYIFLDFKPTKLKNRVYVLEYYLKYRVSKYLNSRIKSVQAQSSKNNILIQIADLLTGAVNHDNNFTQLKSKGKKEFIDYLAKKIEKENLKFCSLPSENKFNIFCIDLN